MNYSLKDFESFAKRDFDNYDLSNLIINKEKAIQNITQEFYEQFKDLNSFETKEARWKHFDISHSTPDDFQERIYKLDSKRRIIFGIRHEGANREEPFVQICTDFELNSDEILTLYKNHLAEFFKVFRPKEIRFWEKCFSDQLEYGSVYLISKKESFLELPIISEEEKIRLVRVTDENYYSWYKAGYSEFHEVNSELKNAVPVNSLTTMESSRKDGLLVYAYLESEKIGLIAAVREEFLGHQGFYFNEIFISTKFKGQGLAKTIQKKFVLEYAQDEDIIWGTIDFSNKSSFKTALSNGRKPIRFEAKVKL